MLKAIKFALLAVAITTITACVPQDKKAESKRLEHNISSTTTEICLRGNKYLYLSAGNTSQVINIWDKNGKIIPCEEGERE